MRFGPLANLVAALPAPFKALAIRFDKSPIASVGALSEFTRTRASYVAQTSLYGYLKTRMGTQFPSYFEDAVFSVSIRTSAAQLFVSCLGDLTVFAVAVGAEGGRLSAEEAAALADHCFGYGLEQGLAGFEEQPALAAAAPDFRERVRKTNWAAAALGVNAFAGSERDIVRFAPVIDEFKALDREIVSNSIRFRWRDVREQLRKRIDSDGVCRDWRDLGGPAAAPGP